MIRATAATEDSCALRKLNLACARSCTVWLGTQGAQTQRGFLSSTTPAFTASAPDRRICGVSFVKGAVGL